MFDLQGSICYDDVQLVPYYSTLTSRSDADTSMKGYAMPVIMSPMMTITTPKMIKLFYEMNLVPTLHRYFKNADEQYFYLFNGLSDLKVENDEKLNIIKATYFSIGGIKKYKGWIDKLIDFGVCNFIVDMAHGDSEICVETCNYLKSKCVNFIAGNVATKSGFARLKKAGAMGIRCGIGGGCFTPKMEVDCYDGRKSIKDVKIGDQVVTHKKRLKKVIDKLEIHVEEPIVVINDILESTRNHEYYVLHEDDLSEFNKTKKLDLFKWVAAEDLTTDYYLIDFPKRRIGKIFKIDEMDYKGLVYDLTVETDHSYNIFGFIVHNSICATRINTAFGVPTLTTIVNCERMKEDTWLIADGGIKNSGDIVKAVRFGADFVMIGKLLAKTDLSAGVCYNSDKEIIPLGQEIYDKDECEGEGDFKCLVAYKSYAGMASKEARQGILAKGSVEGHSGLVKYTGTTVEFLDDLKMNLQASLSYGGSENWKEFQKVKVIKNSSASIVEADTHLDINFQR